MKQIKLKLANLATAFVLTATIASCSSSDDLNNITPPNEGVTSIAANDLSDINIYANNSLLSSSLQKMETVQHFVYAKVQDKEGVTGDQLELQLKGIDPLYYSSWANRPQKTDRGEYVSTDEYNYVMKYLQEHPNSGFTNADIDTYYIQYVGGGNHKYDAGKDQNNTQQYVWNGSNQMDYIQFGTTHINDYNANYGPRAFVNGLPLKSNTPSYHDSWGTVNNQKYNHYQYYYITYNGQKNLYLGFDYTTEKSSGEKVEGDGVYDDYVIKIVPASADNSKPDVTPDPEPTPDPTPTPDPDPTPTPTPDTDPTVAVKPNVEIDLSVKHDNDNYARNETKLSIHVRDTVDVEVFIPVEKQYYCEKDDMYIVERHKEGYWVYNGDKENTETFFMNIAGDEITLTITYEENGIRVKTKGINKNSLIYCRDKFDDGITFEVSNYFTGFNNANELLAKLKAGKPTAKFYDVKGNLIPNYQYYDSKALFDNEMDIEVEQAK